MEEEVITGNDIRIREYLWWTGGTTEDLVERCAVDHKTSIKYTIDKVTKRKVWCSEVKGGSRIRFDPTYMRNFYLLGPENLK